MIGMLILYLVGMGYFVWWLVGVRAHRRSEAIAWTDADDAQLAEYVDSQRG